MKKMYIVIALIAGIIYSCSKDNASIEQQQAPNSSSYSGKAAPNTSSYLDSSCRVCTENKTVTITTAAFNPPILGYGIEMLSKKGTATISDAEIQPYARLTVTANSSNGWLTALPLFSMASDGSYESLNYTYGSSVLMLHYIRFNKATNTFTYKPLNNLVVNYSIVKVM